ncbi:MAG: hypothetical protein IT426_20955 [Pirellulales bacterium]|nr:hypothetical protein [Pirellulales bacterium]
MGSALGDLCALRENSRAAATGEGLTVQTTRIQIIDDITETVVETVIPGERGKVLANLLFVRKQIARRQDNVRLTLHIRPDLLSLHWWAKDMKFARAILEVATIPTSTIDLLKRGGK